MEMLAEAPHAALSLSRHTYYQGHDCSRSRRMYAEAISFDPRKASDDIEGGWLFAQRPRAAIDSVRAAGT